MDHRERARDLAVKYGVGSGAFVEDLTASMDEACRDAKKEQLAGLMAEIESVRKSTDEYITKRMSEALFTLTLEPR